MNVIISQPRYLPAINYINRVAQAERFILLDTVQRQSRGWENRNKLLCQGQPKWVTMPIASSSRALICDTFAKDGDWINEHESAIRQYYKSAPFFDELLLSRYFDPIRNSLKKSDFNFSKLIRSSIDGLEDIFEFRSHVVRASNLDSNRANWERGPEELLRLAQSVDAKKYISGPNGREYGVDAAFSCKNLEVKYHEFEHPVYTQYGSPSFVSHLGFFDILFNIGLARTQKIVHTPLKLAD